ncbi:uncharacterized protein ofcc1 isoform X1 [Misgurnus anguillicaudatus]|uniref:uncharacterized protein ofcc1 isoform X1 n=2 Tax=Misgurnus anguillicaudatus TaxID=75329 RepID=UPI003CCFD968
MDKLQQKAVEQPKQKKSKSAEFLMAEGEEKVDVMKGTVNPAFQEEIEVESKMSLCRDDSTLAAQQQKMELQAAATIKGNEGARNYFDPSSAMEGDPRRCRMSGVGGRDELELSVMNEDEKNLYEKLSKMLQEEDTSTMIDLPGTVMSVHEVEPSSGLKNRSSTEQQEKRTAVMPHYIDQLRKNVQKDMISVGRPVLEQIRHIDKKEAVLQEKLYNVFQRTAVNVLRQRQTEVIDQYGEIIEVSGSTEPAGIRTDQHCQVEWTRTPQAIEVHVLCLRAVRDKLPKGLYSLNVSLQTELGGCTLRWSRLQEQQWSGSTEPVKHEGRYCDTELNINQSLYMVLPASCDLLPSNVLLFRLSLLPSDHSHLSCVVSWGVFPVCDCSLNVLNGKFKSPLLRGGPDPSLKQFSEIEHLLTTDLDNWMCNLYFKVKRLPQGCTGVPERSFTPQVSSQPQQSSGQGLPPHQDTSAPSSASLPGKKAGATSALESMDQTKHPNTNKTKTGIHSKSGRQKKMFGRNIEMLKALAENQLDQFSFSVRSQDDGQRCLAPVCCETAEKMRLVRRLLPTMLDLSWRPRMSQVSLNLLLFTVMWFPRLYLHYCGQWLYLQTKHIPVNRFRMGAHTVDLVYQGSLLSTLEEVLLVLLGPLTLSVAVLLLLLIRWGCQLAFGSSPSFLSKFIMAAAVWTVLDPLAVFAVDVVLGRLSYSADDPLADAAKLYWHFYRTEQSGTAGIVITLFLYAVHSILSFTILYIYILRFHNDGRLLDIYHRLHSAEGAFFIPHDMEVSNQELSYIVKKAEQWRGFSGERRKVAVHDYIWTEEEPAAGLTPHAPVTGCETSTHLSIYTLHPSGLRQHYRHFLRQPDGSIIEVMENFDIPVLQRSEVHEEHEKMKSATHLRERKRRRAVWRSHRVEPLGGSVFDSSTPVKETS